MSVPNDVQQQYATLQTLIRRLDQKYYSLGSAVTPGVNDAAYDGLMHECVRLEFQYPALRADLTARGQVSVTARVGSAAVTGEKVTHASPMLSLANTFEEGDLKAWAARLAARVERPLSELLFVVEPKYDGLSVNLRYEDGTFVSASTRGNGTVGEVVTANLLANGLLGRGGSRRGCGGIRRSCGACWRCAGRCSCAAACWRP